MKFSVYSVLGFVALSRAASATVETRQPHIVTYPIPSGVPTADTYKVQVRSAGQRAWTPLDVYAAIVQQINASSGSALKSTSAMAYFDFSGSVDVSVQYLGSDAVADVQIRPVSSHITPTRDASGNYRFSLARPTNLVFQVNGDVMTPLHLFSNELERDMPPANATDVVYFGPGLHMVDGGTLNVTSGQTLYLAGGAVLTSSVAVLHASNVTIRGRGVVYKAGSSVHVEYSSNVTVEGIISLNPSYESFLVGESSNVRLRGVRAFSATSWGDGIDVYSSQDVLIEGVFLRTSDDCVAVYNHRKAWYGASSQVTVRDSTLWADVAHPINVGTHGNTEAPETMSQLTFSNLDVLDHREPQMDYQGVLAINAGDDNTIRDVLVEDVRVENFREGQLINMRVMYNTKYNTSPGRLISNVTIRNMAYTGTHANPSILVGYDSERTIEFVRFENLTVNGVALADAMKKPSWYKTADFVPMYVNEHVLNLTFV